MDEATQHNWGILENYITHYNLKESISFNVLDSKSGHIKRSTGQSAGLRTRGDEKWLFMMWCNMTRKYVCAYRGPLSKCDKSDGQVTVLNSISLSHPSSIYILLSFHILSLRSCSGHQVHWVKFKSIKCFKPLYLLYILHCAESLHCVVWTVLMCKCTHFS